MSIRVDIGEPQRHDLRSAQAGGISQAEGRPVLDVRRRREKPSDLLRAENNGQAARLTDRHDLLGKIAALQRDLEKNRSALAPALTVGIVVPIDPRCSW